MIKEAVVFICHYPIISHKGAGAYIQIFKISAFSSLENRAAYRRPTPISFFPGITYSLVLFISIEEASKILFWKNYTRIIKKSMKVYVSGKRENKRGTGSEGIGNILSKVESIIKDLCKRLIQYTVYA